MEIKELNDWLKKMDEDEKVGWERDEFLKLNFNDKLAFAVSRFTSQVYNGGVEQFLHNGYEYLIGFLRSEVAETLDQEWLEDYWQEYEDLVDKANYYDFTEDEFYTHLEIFDEDLFDGERLEELREAAVEYLNTQEY
ncbi:MAG: hypothetical protein ACQEQF_00035 [Bacillota bacterium]